MPPALGPGSESSTPTATPQAGSNPVIEASMFSDTANIRIKDSSLNNIQNNYSIQNTTNVNAGEDKRLKGLYRQAARNAISNIGGRAEDAKCHPGTRVEVINLIERWMDDAQGLSRIFWMSGPAGAGKTAIMKTVTEQCRERGVHTANFFFFRGDPTRNLALPLVATLVYQILQSYPAAHDRVAKILVTNPLILQASVGEQFDELIHPLFDIISASSSGDARIVLLIDGLDECDVDANLDQARIIQALSTLATRPHSPFRVLIASRPEARIQMAFNRLSSKIESIFLDEKYSPQEDIRRFVNAEFHEIRLSHPTAASLPHDWPSVLDVEEIVKKSSGQFIFAATVMRYIAQATTVPSLSLERVKGIVPSANNSPFTHLDSVYAFILSRTGDIETVRTILSMKVLAEYGLFPDGDVELLRKYDSRFTRAVIQSCVTELSAIIRLGEPNSLQFYHASMTDFLLDRSRSGAYWIDIYAFRENVLVAFWDNKVSDYNSLINNLLHDLDKPSTRITRMLLKSPLPNWTTSDFATKQRSYCHFLDAIHKLYHADDVKTYKRIVRRFIHFSMSLNSRPYVTGIPFAEKYLLYYDRYHDAWWFNLLSYIRITK